MKLLTAITLTLVGLLVLVTAKPQDDNAGAIDLSVGSDDAGTDNLVTIDDPQSDGHVDDGTDESDGNDQSSGLMDYFRSKGPFGGWPGFLTGSGDQEGQGSEQLRARSFRFTNSKHAGFHRRGLGGFQSHRHSARSDIQNSGPSFNSIWVAGAAKINKE